MTTFAAISLEFRLAAIFVVGIVVAGFMNLAVYRLAWNRRSISPWSAPLAEAPPRSVFDRLPIFGWLLLRREANLHGRGFWIRPLFIELTVGLGLAALYWWIVDQESLFAMAARLPLGGLAFGAVVDDNLRHAIFLGQAILVVLMLTASVIDMDEKTIPDEITVPGTLIGLVLAAVLPWSLPPTTHLSNAGVTLVEFVNITSPNAWPLGLFGRQTASALTIALGCYTFWCFLLLPRVWHGRYGVAKACGFFVARLRRDPLTKIILGFWVAGSLGIVLMRGAAEAHWAALLTSLVGMAVGGGTIWVVRLIGYAVLRREAMGFGDVTLMSMIGAFVGWQAALLIFFLAPIIGLVFGLINLLLRSETEIPYGPFLCGAALVILIWWANVWRDASLYFDMGLLIPIMMAVCLVLMIVLLAAMQLLKALFRRGE